MIDNKINLVGRNKLQISELCDGLIDAKFRAHQIYTWIYQKKTDSFYAMTDLPKAICLKLDELFRISLPEVSAELTLDDGTVKYLLTLEDRSKIEVVRMTEDGHFTLCLSTQVGCPLGCIFCATGQGGYVRDMTVSEIVGSAILLIKKSPADKPVNIVFMGMGEPLLNFDAIIQSLSLLEDSEGIGIPGRRITVSTVGIEGKIKLLKQAFPRGGIALSINAIDDKLRSSLMPVNKTNPLKEVFREVAGLKFDIRNRLTFEFVLIDGVNDGHIEAEKLAASAKKMKARVNVIPLNSTEGYNGNPPTEKKLEAFVRVLAQEGVPVTVRRSKGWQIEAACGQLKAYGS